MKKFRYFFKAGYRKGQHIKVKGQVLTPLEHFCSRGFREGRRLRAKTGLGAFDGTVDWAAFLEVNHAGLFLIAATMAVGLSTLVNTDHLLFQYSLVLSHAWSSSLSNGSLFFPASLERSD